MFEIYEGNELLNIYKAKYISKNKDQIINRLRDIGNCIIAVNETIKKSVYSKLLTPLTKTFEKIQQIVNKNKF